MRFNNMKYRLLSISALLTLAFSTSIVEAADINLSDIEWQTATHGDAYQHKQVQKNKPFTPGNSNQNKKISLKMVDGTTREFDKGLGTIASKPSSIIYDISTLNVAKFTTFVGIDRSATPLDERYSKVDKIEVLVDDTVIYSSLTDYPNGITYDTPAIWLDLPVEEGSKKLELRSYSGSVTWGDEVVFGSPTLQTREAEPTPINELPVRDNMVYLSDLEWKVASHGDATTSKTVQKNKPFSLGNNGSSQKISLKLADGSIKEFDKGLGTIASSPSSIEYNIQGAGVSRFTTFVGLDRSAGHADSRYAFVEKFEVEVDGKVIYTTLEQYPEGFGYDTPAIPVDIEIPENAKTIKLKGYSGNVTWGDELVYAGAYFVATGSFKNPNEFEVAPKRREISNQHPLLMMPLYANGQEFEKGNYAFWDDDTLVGKWENIDPELKPYTVIQIHPDDLPHRNGSAAQFYEHILEEAQNYVNPATGQNEPIPVVLTVFTAGNTSYYTAAHWLTMDWIDEMYEKYSCLQGIFSTENYWIWTGNVESNAAEYLKLSAKHGGYFIWSEQNNGGSIERALGAHGKDIFKNAVEKHWQNFIFMHKNTPAAEGNDAPTTSYMNGLWLSDYAYQWGGLMDTWKWYETGKWKLFDSTNIGKSQGNRQWLTQPEAMLGAEAMNIYLNGGSVYNFEHPAYTYGVKNQESPLFNTVIKNFFKYIIANPAPSKEEVLANTKVILRGNYSANHEGHFFVDVNTATNQSPLYTTGRYGVLPAVPASISVEQLKSKLPEHIQIIDLKSNEMSTTANRKAFLNSLYPEEYTGTIFADEIDNRVFVYNYEYNSDRDQKGSFDLNGKQFDMTLKPHSYSIVTDSGNGLNVILNNYRINKDSLWKDAKNASEARRLPQLSKPAAINWVYETYINNTPVSPQRESVIVVKNLNAAPTIEMVSTTDSAAVVPTVEYDSAKKTATIKVVNNGNIVFNVNY
ncbi:glycoside hydrolase family 98 domain-containing protein [Streptococcus suis]